LWIARPDNPINDLEAEQAVGTAPHRDRIAAVGNSSRRGRDTGRLCSGTVGPDRRDMRDSVALSVSGVSKSYKRRQVLTDVSFEVRQGEALAVVGENGAGKTTLLRICAGAVRADSGAIARVPSVAYCPQDAGLIEHLTADEHVRYVGAGLGMTRQESMTRGAPLLRWLHFPDGETAPVRELSGGTRQKLNLVLALMNPTPLILLDEPYQGFDRGTYENFWDYVATWRSEGAAVVVVTHMLAELHRVDAVLELFSGGAWALHGVEQVAA
jgi:ABC-2 type transport system ATP-binding protein